MVKLVVLALCLVLLAVVADGATNGECPLASKVHSCSPKCQEDRDCASIGGKCCANSCNHKSCLERSKLTQTGDKYNSGSGSYCGNVKCNSFEKCGLDPATKRQKCVRA